LEESNLSRLMISAPQKSTGKTTVSLGIMHNLVEDGVSIQSFKSRKYCWVQSIGWYS